MQASRRFQIPQETLLADVKLVQGALALEKQRAAFVHQLNIAAAASMS